MSTTIPRSPIVTGFRDAGAATLAGRSRGHNEDRGFARRELLAVADGVGGQTSGEVAADMAVAELWALVSEGRTPADEEMVEALERAHRRIWAGGGSLRPMATTCTAASVMVGQIHVVHVGDSRAYLHCGDRLWQLTRDHTVAQELIDNGAVPPDDPGASRLMHVLTQALGGPLREIERRRALAEPGNLLLLCSDGVTGPLGEEAIAEILARGGSARTIAGRLVGAAVSAGGSDDATAVVGRI